MISEHINEQYHYKAIAVCQNMQAHLQFEAQKRAANEQQTKPTANVFPSWQFKSEDGIIMKWNVVYSLGMVLEE